MFSNDYASVIHVRAEFHKFDNTLEIELQRGRNNESLQPIEYNDLLVNAETVTSFVYKLKKYYPEFLQEDRKLIIPIKNFRDRGSKIFDASFEELLSISFYGQSEIFNDLREYQIKGVEWLLSEDLRVMADDMGLGKTLQAIKACEQQFIGGKINKVLIVSPVTLINNWKEELDKWAPKLRTGIVRPSKKEYDIEWLTSYHKNHILITNYEQLRTDSTVFEKMNFDILILDEAHKIKNFSTGISEGVFKVKREKFWALTGTPIENKPQDLASLLLQASPSKMFYLKDEKDPLTLKSIGSKFVLRRTKKDVLKELPDVVEKDISLALEGNQKTKYNEIWKNRKKIADKGGSYFSALNSLREACDVVGEESIKVKSTIELIKNIKTNNDKVLIFSFYNPIIELLTKELDANNLKFSTFIGEQDNETRNDNLLSFKEDSKVVALVASARIASEGLTITEANHVIFLNRWWTPSTNSQARDRVVRIGQEKKVFVYNLFIAETIEERLNEILKEKSDIYEQITESFAEKILS